MKKYWQLLTAILCSFIIMSGCTPNEENGTGNGDEPGTGEAIPIVISPSADLQPTFDVDGGSAVIPFTANADWVAKVISTRADGWCTVQPGNGAKGYNSITIKVASNETYDNRYAVVQLASGTFFQNIEVSQKQKDALILTKNRFEVPKSGDLVEIEVKANVQIQYSIEEAGKDWISYVGARALAKSILTFKVAPNETSEKREATIIFTDGNLSESVTIYQEGKDAPSIVISKSEYNVGSAGETIKVEVSSNVDVETVMPGVDWVLENTTRSMSTHTYYYTILPNDGYESRSAEIIYRNRTDGVEERVVINQAQKDAIVLANRLYEVSNSGGNIEMDVAHNVDYNISINVDWITEVETKAMATDHMTFNVVANTGYDNREGLITFTSADGNIKQEVKVCQASEDALIISQKEYTLDSVAVWFQ